MFTALPLVNITGIDGPVLHGMNFTYTCHIVGGTTTPTYRWFKDGTVIPGEMSRTLFFAPVRQNDAGNYTCEGTRDSLSAFSHTVNLSVSSES